MARKRYDPSADRKELVRLEAERQRILDDFRSPQPLVRGRVQDLRRRCGKPTCRCARGELHESLVFVDRRGGGRRIETISIGRSLELKKPTERYQRLKRGRARLSVLEAEILACCDRLLAHRLSEGKRVLR